MQHVSLKATTTATDQELGTFTALVSAWEADREGDVIEPTAFDKSISAWRESGKNLPLLFEHTTTSVGFLDPSTMHTTTEGLVVSGEVDRETAEGRQTWKMIKSGSASFSIGFMADGEPRKGGGRTLTSIDLLEISVTATPASAPTRALAWKTTGRAASPASGELAGIFDSVFGGSKPDSAVSPSSEKRLRDARARADILEAELEAKAAKEKKAARPIRIARIEV